MFTFIIEDLTYVYIYSQVKIWFQNRRSKFKKIMKLGGTPPGTSWCPHTVGGQSLPVQSLTSAPSPLLSHQLAPSQLASQRQQSTPHSHQLSPSIGITHAAGEMSAHVDSPHVLMNHVGLHASVASSCSTPGMLVPTIQNQTPMSPAQLGLPLSWRPDISQQVHGSGNHYVPHYGSWCSQTQSLHMNSAC